MIHLTEQEAKKLLGHKPEKRHKYNAKKTMIDGIIFDSKREAEYYATLKIRVAAGEVEKFDLQPEFILQPAFTHNGKRIREIKYIADFRIFYPDERIEIVDTKGYKTKDYRLKKKLFLAKYPDVIFTEA